MSASGHNRTHAPQQTGSLFDNFVSSREQAMRDFEANHLGGLKINEELDFGSWTGRSAGLSSLRIRPARWYASVASARLAQQASGRNGLARFMDRRYQVMDGQRGELFDVIIEECILADQESACP